MKGLILDVGCGVDKAEGAIGIDKVRCTAADVIADLDSCGLPFKSDIFVHIHCRHIVEHVADTLRFMEEIHRVARPNATVTIRTPHVSSAYSFVDPTHTRHFTYRTLDHFCNEPYLKLGRFATWLLRVFGFEYPPHVNRFYTRVRFRYMESCLIFPRLYRIIGIEFLANRFPDLYELYLMWIFPSRDLYVVLEVEK